MTDHGEDTWAFLQRHPDYRADWLEHAALPEFEPAPFPVRVQSQDDLAAAGPWSLLAWQDPGAVGDGLASPFWDGVPMLEAIVSRRAPPLLPLLEEAGATVAGLRLRDGLLVLRIVQGGAAVQLLVECDRPFAAGDGLRVFLDVDLRLSVRIGQLRDLWNVVGGPAPRRGRVRGAGLGKY